MTGCAQRRVRAPRFTDIDARDSPKTVVLDRGGAPCGHDLDTFARSFSLRPFLLPATSSFRARQKLVIESSLPLKRTGFSAPVAMSRAKTSLPAEK